jgi:hypothetical protein
MQHLYGDLNEIVQSFAVTMPRMPVSVLDETTVTRMIVFLLDVVEAPPTYGTVPVKLGSR